MPSFFPDPSPTPTFFFFLTMWKLESLVKSYLLTEQGRTVSQPPHSLSSLSLIL